MDSRFLKITSIQDKMALLLRKCQEEKYTRMDN